MRVRHGLARPVQVKICGITTPGDALLALEHGADMLGLNFYPPSPRAIGLETATAIRRAVGDDANLVGVFVNASAAELDAAQDAARLDLLQFHGDEDVDTVRSFLPRAIKALRLPVGLSHQGLLELVEPWREAWGVLFDTAHETLYGGSGQSWDYSLATDLNSGGTKAGLRVLLAGGIRPSNVAEVVKTMPALFAIDVCSGVEAAPGRKDVTKLKRLFMEIHNG